MVNVRALERFNSGRGLHVNTEVYDRNFLTLLMEDTFAPESNSNAALKLDNLNKKKFDFVKGDLSGITLLFVLL